MWSGDSVKRPEAGKPRGQTQVFPNVFLAAIWRLVQRRPVFHQRDYLLLQVHDCWARGMSLSTHIGNGLLASVGGGGEVDDELAMPLELAVGPLVSVQF